MPTRLAKFFSFIAHPMFMPTYSVVLLFGLNTYINQTIPSKMQFMITLLVFINTCILPVIFILVMLKQKFLTSIYLENQKERILPFVMAFFFFGFTYYLLKRVNLPQTINSLMLGATIAVLLSLGFNFYKKISIHMVGISGVFGAFYAISLGFNLNILTLLLMLVLLIGAVGSARLKQKQHTPVELLLGFFVGFITEFVVVIYKLG